MALNNNPQERRRSIRIESALPLRIKTPDFDIVTSTKNISSIGTCCQSDKYVAPMTKLNIVLMLNNNFAQNSEKDTIRVKCRGVVVRSEPSEDKYDIAIYFNDIRESEKEKINNFVKNLLCLPR